MPEATCPKCGARFSHPADMTRGVCPKCQVLMALDDGEWRATADAEPVAAQPGGERATIVCPSCRAENDENNYKCVACGDPLHGDGQPPPAPTIDPTLETLIPYRNAAALAAYYLGVFSLIPCVGVILAILAIAFGVYGLRLARERPETKGKGHAYAGIVLGAIVLVGHLVATIAIVASAKS